MNLHTTRALIGWLIGGLLACQSTKPANPTTDNSRTALDWAGTYQGTTPCADCEGIRTILTLNRDRTFTRQQTYLGKDTEPRQTNGPFSWDATGNRITLGADDATTYQVGENRLMQLDKAGQRITGKLADRYVLAKLPAGLADRYWKLIELNGQAVRTPANQPEAHILLQAADGRLTGSGGCNRLMGSYDLLVDGRIRFGRVGSAMMACPNMQTEAQFLQALNTATSYVLRGDTLVLNRARMAPLARLVAVTR